MMRLAIAVPILLLMGLQACSPTSSNTGRTIYTDKCAICHGANGKGDGELASLLETQPADLTRIAARRDGTWPMLEVMGIIDGYSTRYLPGSEMPIYDEFLEGNLVSFDTGNGIQQRTPAGLLAIVRYLETIQEPEPVRMVP
jgi:mono/diheme cytochrome c family protein